MTARVALYVRVSTHKQAEEGFSVDGQLAELREHAAANGLEIVREIVDQGEKRHTLERPGIDEIQELAAAGAIDEVLAWRWDRYGQSPWPEVLAVELEGMGVALRSLDDGGQGDDAEFMRVIKSLMSKREQKTRIERSRMGMRSKARRGELSGSAAKARYGFRHTYDQRGKACGFEVNPDEMRHIRRIIEMVAAGESYHEVQRVFEGEGIPNPSGGPRWSRTTVKGVVFDDVYKPHGYDEVKTLVSPEALAKLEEGKSYGISWYGQRRSYFTGKGKGRKYVDAPREQWIAIPVPSSQIAPQSIEKARERVRHHVAASSAGDRFWELSGGIVRCGECGRAMIAYKRAKTPTNVNFYYRCRPNSTLQDCPNRKSHPALELEQTARVLFDYGLSDPDKELYRKIHAYYESRKAELEGGVNGERRAALQAQLQKVESKRRNFWEMAADGDIPREVMRERVAALDEEKAAIDAELGRSADNARELEELERVYDELLQTAGELELPEVEPTPEERRKHYEGLGVRFTVDKDGYVEAGWAVAPATHISTLWPPAAVTSRARLA